MTTPGVAEVPLTRFDASRWTRDCLPREAGHIVGRLVLVAVGSLHATQEGYVTPAQVSAATGMTAELVQDALTDAADRGVLRRRRGGFVPVQESIPEDADVLERLEVGRAVDCETCGAPAFTDCRTAAGRLADRQHQPRRSYAARWVTQDQREAA